MTRPKRQKRRAIQRYVTRMQELATTNPERMAEVAETGAGDPDATSADNPRATGPTRPSGLSDLLPLLRPSPPPGWARSCQTRNGPPSRWSAHPGPSRASWAATCCCSRAPAIDILVIFIIFFRVFSVPAFVMLGLWFAVQIFGGLGTPTAGGGVAYWAHAGGFLCGRPLRPACLVPAWCAQLVAGQSGPAPAPCNHLCPFDHPPDPPPQMTLPPITSPHRLTCHCGAVEIAVTLTDGLRTAPALRLFLLLPPGCRCRLGPSRRASIS